MSLNKVIREQELEKRTYRDELVELEHDRREEWRKEESQDQKPIYNQVLVSL